MMKEIVIYLLKASVILTAFWAMYRFYLRKESFFAFNRVFLLSGLAAAFVVPAIRLSYVVKIPYVMTNFYSNVTVITDESETLATAGGFNLNWLWLAVVALYAAGALLFLLRNINIGRRVGRIARKGSNQRLNGCVVVDNEDVESPFTVANYIFMNSSNISGVERDIILKHEMCHIRQRHWIDILFGEMMLAFQWFNPLAWKYLSMMKENHEFLADRAVVDSGINPTTYTQVLVNQTFRTQIFSFSTFSNKNNSKRLAMLKKEKSMNWKKAAILVLVPVFALFLKANAVPEYVYTEIKTDEGDKSKITLRMEDGREFVLNYDNDLSADQDPKYLTGVSTKSDKPLTLDEKGVVTVDGKQVTMKELLNNPNAVCKIEGRTASREEFNKFVNDGKAYSVRYIVRYTKDTGEYAAELNVSSEKSAKDQSAVVTGVASNDRWMTWDEIENHTVGEIREMLTNETQASPGADEAAWMTWDEISDSPAPQQQTERTITTAARQAPNTEELLGKLGGLNFPSVRQEGTSQQNATVRIRNSGGDPLYIIDGKEVTKEAFEKLDYYSIENVTVLKDAATEKYGEMGKNGVIIVTTKGNAETVTEQPAGPDVATFSLASTAQMEAAATLNDSDKKDPLYIIDGKEVTKEALEKLDYYSIENVTVLKDAATEKYGEKGKCGVIIVTTKNADPGNSTVTLYGQHGWSTDGPKEVQGASVRLASTAQMEAIATFNDPDKKDPLYVIDGKETTAEAFIDMDYDDIENVTVLKGASAALYGSKGKDGVVIITTKKGKTEDKTAATP